MSTELDQARAIAERIARRVSEGREGAGAARRVENSSDVSNELAAMRASLEELQRKLVQIESHLTHKTDDSSSHTADASQQGGGQSKTPSAPLSVRSPWLSGMYVPAAHPSQERFGVEEAAVSELVDFFESEKKCELDPSGKPCDHCAMCSSRGF